MATTRSRAAGAIGVAAVLLAACGGGVEGTPVAELWDPCSIRAEALAEAGLDPNGSIPGERIEGSRRVAAFCTYVDRRFDFTAYSFAQPVEVRVPSSVLGDRVVVADHAAVRYRATSPAGLPTCAIALEAWSGSAEFEVRAGPGREPIDDLCAPLDQIVRLLLPTVPF
ncbi:DUF3558 domain-containing protein [Rhodococcoides corynebacterioides]|uniref:DUF3558 domain-containing protein n=1 Tax=Rhodococcoides corynebacterioides TaxID=53972 RepID=A0ABS7P2E9_9NOCA|nr:DUF3558 domain-containing protein [Rhodococcus corynebacterioides]MBY6366586.1 hypothetical protein [Rhodococcus corynebacterioides]MBY6408045.1 hypothetical protein [Rhodococcus corynebacterioides]